MCSQINVSSVEELDSFIEQIMAVPVLLRILAHFFHNDYFGAAQPERHFEGARHCTQHTAYMYISRTNLQINSTT